ncbi:MAG: hypothetical protein U9N34_10400 [Candidatus Cloacimonadota bacterium]|nr:hypothetical protein [Candidatus Cloacimonadota bacterium]
MENEVVHIVSAIGAVSTPLIIVIAGMILRNNKNKDVVSLVNIDNKLDTMMVDNKKEHGEIFDFIGISLEHKDFLDNLNRNKNYELGKIKNEKDRKMMNFKTSLFIDIISKFLDIKDLNITNAITIQNDLLSGAETVVNEMESRYEDSCNKFIEIHHINLLSYIDNVIEILKDIDNHKKGRIVHTSNKFVSEYIKLFMEVCNETSNSN